MHKKQQLSAKILPAQLEAKVRMQPRDAIFRMQIRTPNGVQIQA